MRHSGTSHAQAGPRTLRVRATGTASCPPDLAVIVLQVCAEDLDYAGASAQMNQQVGALRAALAAAGVEAFDLKTRALQVNPRWEQDRVEQQTDQGKVSRWQPRFLGYLAEQVLCIEVPLVGDRLAQALRAVVNAGRSRFQLGFTLQDPGALRQRVLDDAVRKARRAAETMCVAAGVVLGPLCSIAHGWDEGTAAYARDAVACDAEPGFAAINPEDLNAEDTVTCVWELRQPF